MLSTTGVKVRSRSTRTHGSGHCLPNDPRCADTPITRRPTESKNMMQGLSLMIWRRWAVLGVVLICAVVAGVFIYKSKCRGADACAADAADRQERVKPTETQ